MNSINKYTILNDAGLVLQVYRNDLTFDNVKKVKLDIIHDHNFKPDFNFLIDLRKVIFQFTEEEINKYESFISDTLKLEGVKRTALLTSTPEQVVNAIRCMSGLSSYKMAADQILI